jgi:hypothetical protein
MHTISFFDTESKRASIATLITQCIRFIIMYSKIDRTTYLVSSTVFISAIHYVLDIFIAKEFDTNTFTHKVNWFISSFQNFIFTKYIVVICLHTLISSTLYTYLKKEFEKRMKKKHKIFDLCIWFTVNILSNGLYLHFIKFEWAYQEVTDPLFSLIIVSWCSLALMLFLKK